MTEADIDHIQRTLNVTLPTEYTHILINHGGFRGEAERHFSLDPAVILEENQELREEGYYEQPWRDDYFWIGSAWGGEIFVIKLGDASSEVYLCDWHQIHQDGELPPLRSVADSVFEWVQQLEEIPE